MSHSQLIPGSVGQPGIRIYALFPQPEYRALYTFQSATDGDLNFGEGETVLVYWAHDSGWWFGAAGSEQGWFPGSFVEVICSSIVHIIEFMEVAKCLVAVHGTCIVSRLSYTYWSP